MQFIIDNTKCTGCGLCISDCLRQVIELQNGIAVMANNNCFKCGHCLAICPAHAVKAENCGDEILEINGKQAFLDEQDLLTHLKARRSVRQYRNAPVEKEKIEKIIEAGRLTPTASNAQNVRFIVIQEEIGPVEDAVIAQYVPSSGMKPGETPPPHLVPLPPAYDLSRLKRGFLFQGAPLVILNISPSEINGCLAAMSMELMAEALGLGTVYVGLFARPANHNQKLLESLGVGKDEKICSCLAIGYPRVKYQRTAPKKAAKVDWR